LSNANFENLQRELPHELNTKLSKYFFRLATTHCEYKATNNKAIINYYISIDGTEDTINGPIEELFLGDKLYVLNSLGETEYSVNGENFAITYPNIDIESNLLIFRTTEIQNNKGVDGFQIHDLTYGIKIYNFDFDSEYSVYEPIYGNGDYVLFDVRKNESQLSELFVLDLNKKKIYKKSFPNDYEYSYPKLSNGKIVLGKMIGNDAEGYLVYDTLEISYIIKNNR